MVSYAPGHLPQKAERHLGLFLPEFICRLPSPTLVSRQDCHRSRSRDEVDVIAARDNGRTMHKLVSPKGYAAALLKTVPCVWSSRIRTS